MELTDISQVKSLLQRHGFRFSKSMGQNFLVERWVPECIAESAGLDACTGVLEIGPGIGCLTAELSARAGRVLAIELDKSLGPVLGETLAGRDNVEIVFGDALRMGLGQLAEEKLPGLRPVVCANLPYNVTSPLLTAFIEAGCFDSVTVMVQRELARRVCAGAGSGDYGAFSLYVQWHMETELLFDVPPSCFIPRPKVTSTVMRLRRRSAPPVRVENEALMFRLIKAAFGQRRKTLVNALLSGLGGIDRSQAEKALENCGFDTKIRGETLDIVGFAKLSDEINSIMNKDL